MKFDFEGLNISIDSSGKFVIDSIFDKEGNNVQLTDVTYDREGNVIVPDADGNTTATEKETDQD